MNTRRRLTGVVTSDKMEKTVVVEVTRSYRHRLYKKVVHSHKRVMAHDELGCQLGDRVQIVESRPISRHKKWAVEVILRRDITAGEAEIEDLDIEEPEIEASESEDPELEEPESESEAET